MSHGHFINKCSCGAILSQCRCASKDKAVLIVQSQCPKCLSKADDTIYARLEAALKHATIAALEIARDALKAAMKAALTTPYDELRFDNASLRIERDALTTRIEARDNSIKDLRLIGEDQSKHITHIESELAAALARAEAAEADAERWRMTVERVRDGSISIWHYSWKTAVELTRFIDAALDRARSKEAE